MNRRSLLVGLGAVLGAPAVVRAESLMKIAVLRETVGGTASFITITVPHGQCYWIGNSGVMTAHVLEGATLRAVLQPGETFDFGLRPAA
jgi:hypothetical protein